MDCKHAPYCQHKTWTATDDTTRVTRNWVAGLRANFTRRARRFQATAQAQPWQPVVNVQQPPAAPSGPLNPGETVWRTLDPNAEIKVPARMGWQIASYVVVFGGCCLIGWYWRAAIPAATVVGLADVIAGCVFLRLNWDLLGWGKNKPDIDRLITRKRESDTQPVTDPQVVKIKAELHEGRRTLYDELDITDYAAWHQFCKAVLAGRNFSETEAKRHKVPPSDYDKAYRQWVRRGWVLPAQRRGTPQLQAVGKHWVKAYATTPPQPPDAETG